MHPPGQSLFHIWSLIIHVYPISSVNVSEKSQDGRTIIVWSLGVLPTYQGRGLGKVLLRSYQQRMSTSGIADRITLFAHDSLVSMYERIGFENKGKSRIEYAGGGWSDLVSTDFFFFFLTYHELRQLYFASASAGLSLHMSLHVRTYSDCYG